MLTRPTSHSRKSSTRKSRKAARKQTKRKVLFEQLEDRQMLAAGPVIAGASAVVTGDPYMLHLVSGNETPSEWTIDWGDGSAADVITGNPSMASHIYTGAASAPNIIATATITDGEATSSIPASVSGGGDFLDKFAPTAGSDPMSFPKGLTFGPDGTGDGLSDLYVVFKSGDVALVDANTGDHSLFIADVTAAAGLVNTVVDGTDLIFGPNGDLYLSDRQGDRVLRYDMSQGSNGIYEEFIPEGSAGLNLPIGMDFGSDGNLYVGSTNVGGGRVLRFQGPNGNSPGAFIDEFISDDPDTPNVDESGGLIEYSDLEFGPDGSSLYVSDIRANAVMRYKVEVDGNGALVKGSPQGAAGEPSDALFASDQVDFPYSLTFGPDDNILYVTSRNTDEIFRYNGNTGRLIDAFVPRRSGGLSGARFMTFGPDNNLYAISKGNHRVLRYEGPSSTQTSLPVAVVEVSTFSSTDVSKEIPDLATITSTLSIPSGIEIHDLNVQVDITHSRVSELDAWLNSPNNEVRVKLFDVSLLGASENLAGTIFDDEGESIRNASAPYVGSFQPVGKLSSFDLKNATGDWTLEISDGSSPARRGKPKPVESGWLNSWSIIVNQVASGPTPGITTSLTSGLVTTESGAGELFTVVLNTPPTADLTIDIASNDTTEGVVDVSSLNFTRTNWEQPQTVTVTGADDLLQDGDTNYAITLDPISGAPEYVSLATQVISAINLDDEVPPVTPNDIYVSGIVFNSRSRKGGRVHDEKIAVTIRRDSDTDGVTEITDEVVAGANVTVELREGTSGIGAIVATASGVTDGSGVLTSSWIKDLADGTYMAEVTSLSHATYVWKGSLNPTGDVDGDGLSDQVHVIPHSAAASSASTGSSLLSSSSTTSGSTSSPTDESSPTDPVITVDEPATPTLDDLEQVYAEIGLANEPESDELINENPLLDDVLLETLAAGL